MEILQQILVYITVAIALGYMVKKFFLPSSLFVGKKKSLKDCGKSNCGCQ